jgi:hypothetical protein
MMTIPMIVLICVFAALKFSYCGWRYRGYTEKPKRMDKQALLYELLDEDERAAFYEILSQRKREDSWY